MSNQENLLIQLCDQKVFFAPLKSEIESLQLTLEDIHDLTLEEFKSLFEDQLSPVPQVFYRQVLRKYPANSNNKDREDQEEPKEPWIVTQPLPPGTGYTIPVGPKAVEMHYQGCLVSVLFEAMNLYKKTVRDIRRELEEIPFSARGWIRFIDFSRNNLLDLDMAEIAALITSLDPESLVLDLSHNHFRGDGETKVIFERHLNTILDYKFVKRVIMHNNPILEGTSLNGFPQKRYDKLVLYED